jgi:hypothetical protein
VPLDPGILVALSEQDAVPVAVTERVTAPAKPPRGATVIVEVPETVASVVTLVGLALRLMPGGGPRAVIVAETAVEFVMRLFVPPVPVTVTVKVVVTVTLPDREHVVVPVPPAARVTEAGLHKTTSPPEGDTVPPIATAPANWKLVAPRLVRVTRTPL